MARAARSYRAARRNRAIRRLKQVWRHLDRSDGRDGPVYVPIVLTPEEAHNEGRTPR